ncbi:MAG TPA: SDR family oxidoreductase [Stackebrandtia sp.]|jgi:NAD(P)H dehydrogenase (quinone)|uniref:SDR family oxidoreductase n=1 Tax=Stackebrandtia sp. TaxID=2023065 RepID=UPI002D4BB459|nr:SDR family oxidoreductase [Stackebrandtia sp.]HZE41792.1 SDR family oxidoreductase [Stackebrandtia sp.]
MYVVTGATGHLGRLSVEALLARGVAPRDLRVAVRDPAKAADLGERGIAVAHGDYDDPASLSSALAGADKLLFISASEVGQRVRQHTNVIDAAVEAGVGEVAYTSLLSADTSRIGLAAEHLETERLLAASGLPHVLLRNGWYLENYTEHLDGDLEHGVRLGCAADGRVSAAARADYAEAAAVVVTGDGHAGKVYELAGDSSFTMTDLAAEVGLLSGRQVSYRDLPPEEFIAELTKAGLPQGVAEMLADWDSGVARGDLYSTRTDLHDLIGRDTTPLATAVTAAVK